MDGIGEDLGRFGGKAARGLLIGAMGVGFANPEGIIHVQKAEINGFRNLMSEPS